MILEVYIVIMIIAFLLLIVGIYLGSTKRTLEILGDGKPKTETITKKAAIVSILLLAAMLFGVLSYASFNVETTDCLQPNTTITTIDSNTTEETVSCDPYTYQDDTLAYFWSLLAFVSVIFSIIYML